ncbi:hypothetical protein ACFS5J_11115 [Flavobacterium chuncheonense]|uniref:Uncharacterized protein n=1 Tax=Flavobacterium chuncheonense TaxID=2026653 RepID=A0ABW5YNL8_9FLAO
MVTNTIYILLDKLKTKAFLAVVFFLSTFFSQAQCAMCRAALESEEGGVKAEAINDGIVYLMVIPYILVGAAGYAIYRIKYAKKETLEV